ncbi:lysozyme family protein [Azospirillum argentinense]
MVPLTAACIAAVAFTYAPLLGDPPSLVEQDLYTLFGAERGRVGECVPNKDRKTGKITSWDCGPFQINTGNGPALAKLFGTTPEEAMRRVTNDGCLNAHVAGWLLVEKRRAAKGDRHDALGRYNSATPGIKEAYQDLLERRRRQLFGDAAVPAARADGTTSGAAR